MFFTGVRLLKRFFLGGFINALRALVPEVCSGTLVNCAPKAPMWRDGEIARAGAKKPVAQLVIVVHLTAASRRTTTETHF